MFARCSWHNPPPVHRIDRDTLHVVTADRTDFWRTTSYGFIRDTGHVFAAPVDGGFTALYGLEVAFSEFSVGPALGRDLHDLS